MMLNPIRFRVVPAFVTRPGLMVVAMLVLQMGAASEIWAQAKEATDQSIFSNDSYPWYDVESQTIQGMPFEGRPTVRTENRDQIRPYIPPVTNTARGGGSGAGLEGVSFLFWLIIGIGMIGILGLLVWAFLKLEARNRQLNDVATRRTLAESIEQLPIQMDLKTGNFRELAQQASAAGDYRKATILLYSHVLVTLDQASLIRLKKGKTNRQYGLELFRHAPLSSYFQQVMEIFEAVFFGDHDVSRAMFETSWNQLDRFQAEVDQQVRTMEGAIS